MTERMEIIIIGAGITGLSAANYISKVGHKVRVFESDSKVGGLAGFFRVGESYLEKYSASNIQDSW